MTASVALYSSEKVTVAVPSDLMQQVRGMQLCGLGEAVFI